MLKNRLATVLLALCLVLGAATVAQAVTNTGQPRHHNFTEGFYSYFYDSETRSWDSMRGRWTCYDFHIQRLGGIGMGKKVLTTIHNCSTP